jgi:prepilin-type N-terminal cleavage/methylation domain-containing protein
MTALARSKVKQRQRSGGFTLVELMLVVVMIGILSAIAGQAWARYVKKSRTSEAAGHLQKMWVGAMSYYEADHASAAGVMLDKQFPGSCSVPIENDCCLNLDQRCPGSPSVFNADPWKSLNYNISDKHLYRSIFFACPNPKAGFVAEVWGDLDCDGIRSSFSRKADVQASGDILGYPTPAIVNELE